MKNNAHSGTESAELSGVRAAARAKLNLSLSVLGRRPDGYHDLQSVMVSVDLADCVKMSLILSGADRAEETPREAAAPVSAAMRTGSAHVWRVSSSCPDIPEDGGNIVWKAARLFFERADVPVSEVGLHIFIQKNIPHEAGMGGGSADAAAVLRFLYRRWNASLAACFGKRCGSVTVPDLMEIARRCGADVPFCVRGGVVYCEGAGERMVPLASPRPFPVLIAVPDVCVRTADAFSRLDRKRRTVTGQEDPPVSSCISEWNSALMSGDPARIAPLVRNDFLEIMPEMAPETLRILEILRASGASAASLSGSGPACFAVFDDRASCRDAVESLRSLCPGIRCFCASLSPEPDRLDA